MGYISQGQSGVSRRLTNSGFRVQGSGFKPRVQVFGVRVEVLGFRVRGFGFQIQGANCQVSGSGFRFSGSAGHGFRISGSAFQVSELRVIYLCAGLRIGVENNGLGASVRLTLRSVRGVAVRDSPLAKMEFDPSARRS